MIYSTYSQYTLKLFNLGSLFEQESVGQEVKNRAELNYKENKSWDSHLEAENETSILEKTPAMGLDYIYTVEYPSDSTSEDMLRFSTDMEHSNLPERALCRFVIGPTNIHVDSDFVHRLSILIKIVDEFEGREDIEDEAQPTKLEIPSKLEIDSLENNNPSRIYQLTVLHPVFTFYVGDVRLEAGFRCLDVSLHTPMYALRNVKASRNKSK